ncbi:MAG: transporter substrate-binding domain-containing protein [Parvibaculaceae bacterium]
MIKLRILAATAILLGVSAAVATAGTLDDVKSQGKLVVGVKADYRPYGYLDPSGQIVGLEPDLARNVADRLGVGLELVPVIASNRVQFLQQGKVDLLIATMANTEERRKVMNIPQPDYYASYASLMAPKDSRFTAWTELRGEPVCVVTGGFYNQMLGETYGANLVAFKGTAEAFRALQMGSCVGFMYDDTFLVSELQKPEWSGYKLVLPSIQPVNWGIGVRKGDDAFTAYMSEVISAWHKSGVIAELEKKWHIPATPFVTEMHEKLK